VLEKLVGDNPSRMGIFGQLEAYGAAFEEQARRSVHCHILVYIKDWNQTLIDLNSTSPRTRSRAEKKVCDIVDNIISTQLTPDGFKSNANSTVTRKVLKCPNCDSATLEFADIQTLRNLRHKVGSQQLGSNFAKCSTCNSAFDGNQLAYKRYELKDRWDLPEPHRRALLRRDALLASIKTPEMPYDFRTVSRINELYNHHLAHHTKTCFKKGDECRANLPECAEDVTQIIRSPIPYEGFTWTGEPMALTNITIRPRRRPQDAFTNTYSPHITNSRAPANSNIQLTTGARSCIYATCYTFKPTQAEDTQESKRLLSYCGHRFLETRRDNPLFEGISRLMGAAIIATSEHVIAASMAALIVRNGSRFKCSHKFKYVPIREMVNYLNASSADNLRSSVMPHDTGCFLTNDALSYIFRPSDLEEITLLDFNEQYETVRTNSFTDCDPNEGTYELDDVEHPGYGKQYCQKRKEKRLAQFSHWSIPDTSTFGGNVWSLQFPVNASVERWCQTVLILFYPFRHIDDLTTRNSYFLKFRSVFHDGMPTRVKHILSNVQMFYNSMRMPPKIDPVFDATVPFTDKKTSPDEPHDHEEEDDSDEFLQTMFSGLLQPITPPPTNGIDNLSLERLKADGARGCAYKHLPKAIDISSTEDLPFLQPNSPVNRSIASANENSPPKLTSRDCPTPFDLMHLVYKHKRRRLDTSLSAHGVTDFVADGSAASIIEWSQKQSLGLDQDQQNAFQIATAAFILTYYEDAKAIQDMGYRDACPPELRRNLRHSFITERRKLRRLTRLRTDEELRMFLDGPGGAGKSEALKQFLHYAEQFTTNMHLTFDTRTVIVSAISGVAAVSIGGETTSRVASLNKAIADDDTSWANARLLIIDEISFMSTADIETLDQKLRTLMKCHTSLFGGLNIIFSGDFHQLEPITGTPLYANLPEHKKWRHSINSYVELKGMWRFKDDPEWGHILSRLRTNTHTQRDIDAINQCTIENKLRLGIPIPENPSYCVYANKDRSAINAAIFEVALKSKLAQHPAVPSDFLVIKASDMHRKHKSGKSTPMEPSDCNFIYSNCSDTRVRANSYQSKNSKYKDRGHFLAPMLKLHKNQALMLVANDDVANGHANGTRVVLKSVVTSPGATTKLCTIDGRPCHSILASEVDHLLCHLEDNPSKVFKIKAKQATCKVKAPLPASLGVPTSTTINFTMQMTQFPAITNYATTGHKLQGQSKQNLIISVWSNRRNWNYVALSRVRTRAGLFLVKELPYDADFSVHEDLLNMKNYLIAKRPANLEEIELD
jgi:AAA domain